MSTRQRVGVLGGGSWGATLANLLAANRHDVTLWEFDSEAAAKLQNTRKLAVLPHLVLNPSISVTSHLADCLKGHTTIVCATPSHFVRSTMNSARKTGVIEKTVIMVSVSKGLEERSHKTPTQVISEELSIPDSRLVVLSGPSHAEEVCRNMPTATVAAGTDPETVKQIQLLFAQEYFRVYGHSDILGVELGASLKNVYAIACGISDGLGFGDNTRAALLTRALNEMSRLGVKMGAQLLTFFGLAGIGDLVVTCLSTHSRNHALGQKIGQGKTPKQALSEMTMVAEGMRTAPSAYELMQKYKLESPLTTEIYRVLYEGKDPRMSLHDLMERKTLTEWQGLDIA